MPPDRRLIGWRAWFEGGAVYTGSRADSVAFDVSWAALPDDGCLYIRAYHADKASFVFGEALPITNYHKKFRGSLYFMAPGPEGWIDPIIGANEHDTKEEMRLRYPGAIVKSGKWTTYAEDRRLQELVAAAKDAP